MKHTIYMPGSLPPDLVASLNGQFVVLEGALTEAQSATVRGVATRSMIGADAALMARFPKLEIISVFGVGCDAVDLGEARRRGVIVTNTPDVLTQDTADFAFALLIALARRIPEADRFVRAGKWPAGGFPNSTSVRGKTLGIVGMGRIGQAVAQRAVAFDMKVIWNGPRSKPSVPYPYCDDLPALAAASDFLVLTCPGGAETNNLVDAAILERLGPSGFLVNIARGSVVEEGALISALENRAIAGAALDVFAYEPQVPEALLRLDNVVLAPHVSSVTTETRRAVGALVLANLVAHFDGAPVPTPVTPA